ncbi:hypothetical protein AYM40_32325 [Paraburkholderia phytofirmans OLGA172]|uniref:Uncharacterized protein n=1 Tax=Paraburkholderia phytofirmans OLGA172 TaxID=1417228 RepID=A0A160FUV6_9BURK|nr:hypothetical protein AYM40_32325 [Paraburkholderia phytofirmans OLGA172]
MSHRLLPISRFRAASTTARISSTHSRQHTACPRAIEADADGVELNPGLLGAPFVQSIRAVDAAHVD